MPVRIYDISKKLGLENKEVLAKAKALGIAAARVASSSLDKITAEYLEQQIILEHPHLAVPRAQPPPEAQPTHTAAPAPATPSPIATEPTPAQAMVRASTPLLPITAVAPPVVEPEP